MSNKDNLFALSYVFIYEFNMFINIQTYIRSGDKVIDKIVVLIQNDFLIIFIR